MQSRVAELEALYRQRFAAFARVALSIAGSVELAREVVQESFARAIEQVAGFRGECPLEAWVWRIVVNRARTEARSRTHLEAVESAAAAEPATNGDDEISPVQLWVRTLPERQRLVVFLRYWADLDYRAHRGGARDRGRHGLGHAQRRPPVAAPRTSGGAAMIDVESLIREEFTSAEPLPPQLEPDWAEVLARVQTPTRRGRRRQVRPLGLALAAALVGLTVAALATPLGAAIGRGLDGFSAWISGSPGTPASPQAQQAFERANARSWAGFPPGTELRKLIETRASGSTFTLYGFRSGDALCLRLVATGAAAGKTSSCAPLQALQGAKEPALVVASDEPFGSAQVPPGSPGYHPLLASATFGIASDGVQQVILHGDDGTHQATVESNAFLYIDEDPKLGVRIRSAEAVAADGSTTALPLAAAPYGGNGSIAPDHMGPPQGPTGVDRHVSGSTVSWIEQRQDRGQPLDPQLLKRLTETTMTSVTFAREVQPDPANPARIVFLVGTLTHSFHPDQQSLCVFLLQGGGAGGGCGALREMLSEQPFNLGISLVSGADQYAYFSGMASDEVAALKIFLANGTIENVPLKDNAFAVPVARALFPARVVAYGAQGEIIGNEVAPTS